MKYISTSRSIKSIVKRTMKYSDCPEPLKTSNSDFGTNQSNRIAPIISQRHSWTGSLQQGACSQIHRKTPTPTLGTKRTRVSASTQHCIHACVLAKVFKEHVAYYIYKKNGARFAEVGYCCFSSHTQLLNPDAQFAFTFVLQEKNTITG